MGLPLLLGDVVSQAPTRADQSTERVCSRKAGVRASTETVFSRMQDTSVFPNITVQVSKAAMSYLKYVGENRCSKNKRYSLKE